MEQFLTKSQRQTNKLAEILAQEIIRKPLNEKNALVIGLEGELGSGKTTFIKGFAKGLGIRKKLTSPTFVLMKKYKNLYHIDCYRIKSYKDILALDFKEIIFNPKNIIVVEWAEKIRKILPRDKIWIKFEIISNKEREIKIT